ncbi:HEAT repeat domain-containing protein, partial [Butyricicoccus sp. 1XD8-22]
LDRYIPFVSSDIWEERLMAAKLLQNVPLKGSLSYLEKLLEDESWLVRTQAAQAIEK